jgi:beta-barrel assembly-enhancing protease
MFKSYKFLSILLLFAFLIGCKTSKNPGGRKFNLFTVQQDRDLGAQVAAEIDANKAEFPQLDSAKNRDVYAYIYKVRDKILNSGKVKHKNDFQWRIRVIKDDSTLNAFCTPGGYIYVYTGILRFLDNEAEFAGVMGHEIAHADLRHSTRQMTKIYGIQVMLEILAGERKMLKEITAGIINLKFSREHETEADYNSVMYLCPTDYNAAGGAGFFRKIEALGGSRMPQFLSTHPNPVNRIEQFENNKTTMGCSGGKDFITEYKAMVAKLPK